LVATLLDKVVLVAAEHTFLGIPAEAELVDSLAAEVDPTINQTTVMAVVVDPLTTVQTKL
jgi:hypothetical protein